MKQGEILAWFLIVIFGVAIYQWGMVAYYTFFHCDDICQRKERIRKAIERDYMFRMETRYNLRKF